MYSCLPRMRGDRPCYGMKDQQEHVFTPHARGSTIPTIERGVGKHVYPACAGIDLDNLSVRSATSCLPRMRGDRPLQGPSPTSRAQFTPHARGSTVNSTRSSAASYVYPACAGIDRVFFTVSKFSSRLPRMRGDRPTEPIEWFRLIVFTPHTRGQIAVRRV